MFTSEQENLMLKALIEVSQTVNGSYDEMVVAGGCPRDLLHDKKPRDIDVFIINPNKTLENSCKKKLLPMGRYTLNQPEPEKIGDNFVAFDTGLHQNEVNIQVILTNTPDVNTMLDTFDYDFNGIAYNQDDVFTSTAFEDFYMQDDDVNYITFQGNFNDLKPGNKVTKRLLNFLARYTPDFKFRDSNGTVLDNDMVATLNPRRAVKYINPSIAYQDAGVLPAPEPINPERAARVQRIVENMGREQLVNARILNPARLVNF